MKWLQCLPWLVGGLVFLLPAALGAGQYVDYDACAFTLTDDNNVSAQYNLTVFHLKGSSYSVEDNEESRDWVYWFNVCGAISDASWDNDVPKYCRWENGNYSASRSEPCMTYDSDGACKETYNVKSQGKVASGIQISSDRGVCIWLGVEMDKTASPDYTVSLYDSANSAAGIVYTIENGAWCSKEDIERNRQLVIELICPDLKRYTFDPQEESKLEEEVVIEYPSCVYTITYETPLACPWDCMAMTTGDEVEYGVCSGHGICVADPNADMVQCLCDDDWTGDLCDIASDLDVKVISSVHGAMITSVVICIILLVIGIGMALYLCHRIRLKEEQVAGAHGQFAQSMLDSDQSARVQMNDDGTSMGIVSGSRNFSAAVNVDPTVQNEIAQQHARDIHESHSLVNGNEDNEDNEDNDGNGDTNQDDDGDTLVQAGDDKTTGSGPNETVESREEADLLGAD